MSFLIAHTLSLTCAISNRNYLHCQSLHRSAAVAEGEFGFDVEFGHGLFLLREVEEWVVAEALDAAWGGEDLAFDCAVTHGEDFAVARGGEDAVVAGAALGERNASKEVEEVEVVALVC